MDDRTFFDHLFQQFAKTTWAENAFWMPEENKQLDYDIIAVSGEGEDERYTVAENLQEVDADFIAAVHGCLPDLVRRLHDALDEADRADRERDEREREVFRLALEVEQLSGALTDQEQNIFALAVENDELRQEVGQLRRERESWVSRAGDALWKIERPM